MVAKVEFGAKYLVVIKCGPLLTKISKYLVVIKVQTTVSKRYCKIITDGQLFVKFQILSLYYKM